MISYMSKYVYTIITIVISASFINLLVPNGNIKKYVRFGIGLIIISCFVNLIAGFKGMDFNIAPSYTHEEYSHQSFVNQLKIIYTEKLEREVKEKFKVADIKITVGDDMEINNVETSDTEKKKSIEAYLGVK